MIAERPIQRMTLREVLTHASKVTHDVVELANKTFQGRIDDLADVSRPTRRKSHYPAVGVLQNSVHRYAETSNELVKLLIFLEEHFQAIRDQVNRARSERR